jgi:hypothetical protein
LETGGAGLGMGRMYGDHEESDEDWQISHTFDLVSSSPAKAGDPVFQSRR